MMSVKMAEQLKNYVSGDEATYDKIRALVAKEIKDSGSSIIDFEGQTRLSPSIAYNAFGKLVDSFGPNVFENLTFKNDSSDLQKRIESAIARRVRVLQAEGKFTAS